MDETKVVTIGLITGSALGWGLAIAGAFVCPAVPVIIGTGATVVSMIGGAAAGGTLALKIAEKINKRKD